MTSTGAFEIFCTVAKLDELTELIRTQSEVRVISSQLCYRYFETFVIQSVKIIVVVRFY